MSGCCLTSTPRSQEETQRLRKPRNTELYPGREVQRPLRCGDEDACEGDGEPAAPDLGSGIKPGSVTAVVCFHCVLSGAGEKDASAAADSPPAPTEQLDYSAT